MITGTGKPMGLAWSGACGQDRQASVGSEDGGDRRAGHAQQILASGHYESAAMGQQRQRQQKQQQQQQQQTRQQQRRIKATSSQEQQEQKQRRQHQHTQKQQQKLTECEQREQKNKDFSGSDETTMKTKTITTKKTTNSPTKSTNNQSELRIDPLGELVQSHISLEPIAVAEAARAVAAAAAAAAVAAAAQTPVEPHGKHVDFLLAEHSLKSQQTGDSNKSKVLVSSFSTTNSSMRQNHRRRSASRRPNPKQPELWLHSTNTNQILAHQAQHEFSQTLSQQHLFPTPPPPRPWVDTQQQQHHYHHHHHVTKDQEPEFTVISYNVLCDRMVSSAMFPSSPDIALNWHYRRELIVKQLVEFDADIIALQELELEQYERYFEPQLFQMSHYVSIFEPKSRAKTMDSSRRSRVDGCAIFFKTNKFKLIQRHLIEFNQIAMANSQGSEAMLNRVMTKDNIGLVAVLELIEPSCKAPQLRPTRHHSPNPSSHINHSHRFIVCNTHIHWDPEHCDVKLIQSIMLMKELESIARHHGRSEEDHQQLALAPGHYDLGLSYAQRHSHLLPLVLLGDFNSLPNSGVTTYLTGGKINSLHQDFKNFRYTNCSNTLSVINNNPVSSSYCRQQAINQRRHETSSGWSFYPPSPSVSPTSTLSSNSSSQSSDGFSPPFMTLEEPKEEHRYSVLNYDHPFRLASAYDKDMMPYTNYTTNFKAVIDYIFYSSNSIQLVGLLGPLDKNWLKANRIKGLPQPYLPSDHLPLLVKLKLLCETSTRGLLAKNKNYFANQQQQQQKQKQQQQQQQQQHQQHQLLSPLHQYYSQYYVTSPDYSGTARQSMNLTINHQQNRS